MLRQLSCALLCCAAALSSTPTQAANHALAPHLTYDFTLRPSVSEEFTNFTFFYIEATCHLETGNDGAEIDVVGKNRSGRINGSEITKGMHVVVPVHNGDAITLGAESAAQVALTNLSKEDVVAHCYMN